MHARADQRTVLQPDDFFRRASALLTLDVPAALADPTQPAKRGDMDVDPETWTLAGAAATRPAAVLIGVIDRREPMVVLTQRTTHLPSHPGQVAFPGGKIDDIDPSPAAAALREAHEEIGLEHQFVHPIGYLDLFLTMSGYRVLPTVARVDPGYQITLNANEVDEAFEVPLEFLLDPRNHLLRSWNMRGFERAYYEIPFEGRRIWGVTAGIVRNLYERMCLA